MRTAYCLAACLVLASCAGKPLAGPHRDAAEAAFMQRESGLRELTAWDLAGKLSIDDGQEGGSGQLRWKVSQTGSQMNFRGALGKGAWRLTSSPGHAELSRADGSSAAAGSVNELVEAEIGWHVPVDALQWWALGVPAPGEARILDLDPEGRVVAMQQNGWNISYQRYRQFGKVDLPGRMDAVRGRYRVKMAVSSWKLSQAAND